MTTTGFNFKDLVSFGTATPPTGPAPEGANYFVTSDGTETGTVLEMWTYDSVEDAWVQTPVGGNTCPGPMTRAALIGLRNAGNLSKDCHYIITDYNRGTVGTATLLLHATDTSTLSMDVHVSTGFDNVAWDGRYDIDANRITALYDNLGNKVDGQELVDVFPWGNSAVYDNIIEEGATFTYTQGAFFDNVLRTGAIVVSNGSAGNFARNVIGEDSNVTWTAGDVRDNIIGTDAVVIANTTGDFDNNEVHSFARVEVTGAGNADRNYFGQNSNTIVSGGTFADNRVETDATVTVLGGQVYENSFGNGTTFRQTVNNRGFYQNILSRRSNVVQGDTVAFMNEFAAVTINWTGSTGNGIRYSKFYDSFANTGWQNIAALDLAYVTLANNSQIVATGAARVYLRYFTLENYGRLLVSAGTLFDGNYTGLRDYSYIQLLGGRLYVNYTSVQGVSYVQQAATVTGTNRVERTDISSQSRVRFLNTVTGCRVYYCELSSGGYAEHRGTSRNCYFYYCKADSAGQLYFNNSVNGRMYYSSATGRGIIYSQGQTGVHNIYYCTASSQGQIIMINCAGTTNRFYGVQASGLGIVRMQNNTGGGRLYYSHIMAYYYLYITLNSLTRSGLHGYGRRTYTVTNPATNGASVENF